ncbi:hypothetical protein Tco_0594102 [Tanacetum coccineum]
MMRVPGRWFILTAGTASDHGFNLEKEQQVSIDLLNDLQACASIMEKISWFMAGIMAVYMIYIVKEWIVLEFSDACSLSYLKRLTTFDELVRRSLQRCNEDLSKSTKCVGFFLWCSKLTFAITLVMCLIEDEDVCQEIAIYLYFTDLFISSTSHG